MAACDPWPTAVRCRQPARVELLWVGGSRAMQVRTDGERRRDLELVLIDPGTCRRPGRADPCPRARPRSSGRGRRCCRTEAAHPRDWGANDKWRNGKPRYIDRQAGPRPPHRHRQRLLARRRARHPARHVPLPHQDPGLVRHRLQLPRRPVRPGLDRPLRRAAPAVRGAHTLGFNIHLGRHRGDRQPRRAQALAGRRRRWPSWPLEARRATTGRRGARCRCGPRAATSTPRASGCSCR